MGRAVPAVALEQLAHREDHEREQDALRLGLAGVLVLSGIKLLNVPEASYVIAIGLGLGLAVFAVWVLSGMPGVQSRGDEAERTDDLGALAARRNRDRLRGDAAT